jgi:hypothetical protein
MSKTAIIILSDPKAGSEEALGRVFNALAAAYDFKHAGEEVKIIFQGAGTRWPEQLEKSAHPVNGLFLEVKDKIQGVSTGCAAVFGADVSGYDLLNDNKVPGTPGLPSFVSLKKDGYDILVF